jgi:hypothetical protein
MSLSLAQTGESYVRRWSFLRLKYPSSYPDFNTVPFCTTTVTRPVNFSWASNRSVAVLSSSNSCTLRRNSVKDATSESQCFGSMTTSKNAALDDYEFESVVIRACASNDLFLLVVTNVLAFNFKNISCTNRKANSPCLSLN